MKFARVGQIGRERPAVADREGKLRDLSALHSELDCAALPALSLQDVGGLPLIEPGSRVGVPVANVRKFIAIGLNYTDHAAEGGMSLPEEPIVFSKAISCLAGPDDDVPLPRASTMSDWEIELGIVIGRKARYVTEVDALEHVAGYVLVNDLSERQDQLHRGGSWDKGKGHDGFGPVGPWLVTRDELGDASNIPLRTVLNGAIMQDGNTGNMIFGVAELVAYVSRFITLEPGDIITTGTPAGVGMGRKPEPVFLKPGDVLELDGGPLGRQRQKITEAV